MYAKSFRIQALVAKDYHRKISRAWSLWLKGVFVQLVRISDLLNYPCYRRFGESVALKPSQGSISRRDDNRLRSTFMVWKLYYVWLHPDTQSRLRSTFMVWKPVKTSQISHLLPVCLRSTFMVWKPRNRTGITRKERCLRSTFMVWKQQAKRMMSYFLISLRSTFMVWKLFHLLKPYNADMVV